MKKMTIFGIGHKLMASTGAYFIAAALITIIFPRVFYIVPDNLAIFAKIGGGLILIPGLIFYINAVKIFLKLYPKGVLITEGAYSLCRNPLYAAWIVFIIPATALIINSWILFTTALFMYLMLCLFIREEEEFLQEKFGEEYLKYCNEVNRVIPIKK